MAFNLTDGLAKSFTFSGEIEGKVHEYEAFYPTAKQLRPLQLGYARLKEINDKLEKDGVTEEEKKSLEKDVEKASKEMTDAFTSMFKPLNDSMPIDEFLDNLPSNARKNFDEMVQKELLNN